MRFHSLVFVAFFVPVYLAYLALRRHPRAQNGLLLVASYVFYGYWDARFVALLAFSTAVDYLVGRALGASSPGPATRRRRRMLLGLSLVSNLGVLGCFKYFDFFAQSAAALLGGLGMHADPFTLDVVLPVGISFYTFQTLSYTMDVYRGHLQPTRDPLAFAAFVAFFPQLVAGPIERASHLLPQMLRPRQVDAAAVGAGLELLLLGYFKKLVVADNMAPLVDATFRPASGAGGVDVVLGVLAFSLQIYGDFSGYSDIARGLSRLMGFELMVNFRLPYFARNPSEFWRRWHISLSTWLRDYLYIPLGGNRRGRVLEYRNLVLTMLLGGLWHGAAFTFVLWGAYHGAILCAYRLLAPDGSPHARAGALWGHALSVAQVALMGCLTMYGWLIFRAQSPQQVWALTRAALFAQATNGGQVLGDIALYAGPLLLLECAQYASGELLLLSRLPTWARGGAFGGLLAWIFVFGSRQPSEFIYFQF